jgi:hypothetical protein
MHRCRVPQRRSQGWGEFSLPDPDARAEPDMQDRRRRRPYLR